MAGWHSSAKLDARGRPRVIDFKTTADIWWRKEHDNVQFGPAEELAKLSYYPTPEAPFDTEPTPEGAPDFDPLAQFPGLSVDESFQLDVSGFLLLRGALGPAEVAAAQRALAENEQHGADPLADHPEVQRCLHGMCGEGFRQDTHCAEMPPATLHSGDGGVPLRSVEGPARLWGKEYRGANKSRGLMPVFRGARVCWALRGEPSLTVVAASHLNAVETPDCVRSGEDHLGASQVLDMRQGDLLVCAATLLHGVNPPPTAHGEQTSLLMGCEYVCAITAPAAGYTPGFAVPAWLDELTPEQKSVVATRGQLRHSL